MTVRLLHAGAGRGNLVPGPGERHERARWSECIGHWARASARFGLPDGEVRCSPFCQPVPPDRGRLHHEAAARREWLA